MNPIAAIAIQIAKTPNELEQCFPVVVQLRPHLQVEGFVQQVQRQQEQGYQLVYLEAGGEVRAIAGFRLLENLSRGRMLYVDDLVTDAAVRSKGYGKALFHWLLDYARSHDCQCLDLDSGVQRGDAHRFYFQNRMTIMGYHFTLPLT